MLDDFTNLQAWNEAIISEEETLSEADFWHCCIQLHQSLDELIKAKNTKAPAPRF
jgi:hypothetical protein